MELRRLLRVREVTSELMNSQDQNTPVYLQEQGKSWKSRGTGEPGEFKVAAAATGEYGR